MEGLGPDARGEWLIVTGPRGKLACTPDRTWTIGRGDGCDVVVPDPSVSRRHAELRWSDGSWELVDLASTNGTWVAGRRVERVVVDGPLEVGVGKGASTLLHLRPDGPEADVPLVPDAERTTTPTRGPSLPDSTVPVFISFAEEDGELADEIRRTLEQEGIPAWSFTRRRQAGEYQERQRAALRGCSVFLCVITPWYEGSGWCRKELQYATAREKVVLPVVLTEGWDWEGSDAWDRLLIYNAVRMQAFDDGARIELIEMVASIVGNQSGGRAPS